MVNPKLKKIVLIGAGREQVQAYRQAKEMGLHVVGTDMDPEAPAFSEADDVLICSTRDVEETLASIKAYAASHPVHGVMTVANDVPYTVARVARELKLPGIPPECALLVANKISMKQKFLAKNVATPAFTICCSKSEFLEHYQPEKGLKILKPSDGRGSRGVLFLDGTTDPNWAWDESYQHSENGILMLEDFLGGPQLSVEGLMIENHYHAIAFADRNYDNMEMTKPYIVEDGGIIPTRFPDEQLLPVQNLIENASRSMGIHWGPVKADIVLTEDGPYIIELAARLSGNYLATHHIPMAYGINIVDAMIRMTLGEPINTEELKPKWKKYLGVRYFFPDEGVIESISGVSTVRKLDYVKYLDIYTKVGATQLPIQNHTTRAGTIICEGSSYKEAFSRVESAVSMITFNVISNAK